MTCAYDEFLVAIIVGIVGAVIVPIPFLILIQFNIVGILADVIFKCYNRLYLFPVKLGRMLQDVCACSSSNTSCKMVLRYFVLLLRCLLIFMVFLV